jgi:flagellar hook protein FlgE
MNTTAYKAETTDFSDLFYQQIGSTGSGDPIQVGGGVKVASNSTDFTQGSYDTSGTTSSDVALDGNGFFVVNDGSGANLLTRNGAFTQAANGNLTTADGLNVMGYPALNGVVNTNAQLTAINVPVTGQVQQPQATTTFGMTANLDSSATVGTSVPGQVQVFDSLGNNYEATVTYTKTGTNQWSYAVTLPDNVTTAPAVPAGAASFAVLPAAGAATTVTIPAAAAAPTATPTIATLTPSATISGSNTIYNYNFGTGGTVDDTTGLTIGGVAVVVPPGGETTLALEGQITALAQAGVTANLNANGNALTITAPTTTAVTGPVVGDLAASTTAVTFNTGGTVDPSTNLTITGLKADGTSATIDAPLVPAASESIDSYATSLRSALAADGITNVTITTGAGKLSIAGTDVTSNMDATHGVFQSLAATTTDLNFGTASTVDPATNLTITGQTATGAPATINAPNIAAGETVANYAIALNTALGNAHIVGVKASSIDGQLSIVGANSSIAGNVSQDLTANTISYNFGSSAGTVATVNPSTNLTITGLTSTGASATITAPTVTSGETVGNYVTALNAALTTAGIAGVNVTSTAAGKLSIVGSNVTTSGSVIQDPVAANAGGILTFDSNGNLVSPAADVAGISFAGLSDGAATMNMTWNILGTAGKPSIGQVDATSTASAGTQNGYPSGSYKSFSIGTDGTVSASYSNGQTEAVGQLALANVTNLQGLELLGNGNYATTTASGAASIGTSGTSGLGTLQGSSLEESNVNISAEFSDLIIAQRGFEANSKAITTFDTITQETINMIH